MKNNKILILLMICLLIITSTPIYANDEKFNQVKSTFYKSLDGWNKLDNKWYYYKNGVMRKVG